MTRLLPQPSRGDIDIVTVLHALADPVRLELIRDLSVASTPKTCSLSGYELEITAPTLSHHWRVLRESGLTSTVVDGRTRWVELRRDDIEARFPGLLTAVLADMVTTATRAGRNECPRPGE
ncbi:ArsR/SmtB family transcription factor [Actinocrispum wychmicini]|uniref:DNA-binding transcriptional ArsR family regulator n=1 Tax=Actinocrispum wychmicini TaxID=1213861 RepID=A0A4R2J9T3_9PSEU|nr:helix-turn-helix domain-containing protein [Actinocrispum wychmicini]TCO55017.1 DNA-binding transcriptional ArsR family regulator [Actinocrispum wychmicini]